MPPQTPSPARRPGWLIAIILAGVLAAAHAATSAGPNRGIIETDFSESHASFLPNVFLRYPTLEMTVFTEMTDYGRSFVAAAPDAPVYFVAQDKGQQSRGYLIGGDKPMPQDRLNEIMYRSLASQGYLPAGEGHPAGLALVYFWGSHNAVDRELTRQFPERAEQDILERATLVGGKAFAHKLAMEFHYGDADLDFTAKKRFLRVQAVEDVYYAVVSAYAYDDIAHNQPRLVWRTTMTVNTRGVSMGEGLPPLIATAGAFFGRETAEPLALRREVRRGTVKLGPLQIIEEDVPAARPAAK